MKTFALICPHCREAFRLEPHNVEEWYDCHVTNCSRVVTPSDSLTWIGRVFAALRGPGGIIKDVRLGFNLVVTTGREAAIDRLQAAAVAVHDYQAIGTGTTAAAAGNTALETEVARGQGTLSQPTSTTDRLVTTFAAGTGTGAITETGRLNAAAAGNLFARQVFSVINKGALDSLTVTHDITD